MVINLGAYLPNWTPALDRPLAADVIEKALLVAHRLRVPERVEQAAQEAHRETLFPRSVHWTPHSLAQGYAGLTLLWSHLDSCFPNQSWDRIGHEYLQLALSDVERYSDISLGLFSGLSGIAFAAWLLSRGGLRYRRLLQTLDEAIGPNALGLARSLRSRNGMSVSEFDAISGLSGLGAYLLCRRDNPLLAEPLRAVTSALVDLCSSTTQPPSWYTPCRLLGDESLHEVYPHGCLNVGLAHGIPGPLAFLSLAQRERVDVAGLPEAIRHVADWLRTHRCDDQWGLNWPTAIPLDGTAEAEAETPSRSAWCYGSPGIARALWLAGTALDDDEYRQLAVASLEAVFRRPIVNRQIDSPTLCHGVGGLLTIALRFRHDLGGTMFSGEIAALVHQMLERFRPDSLLGFKNVEYGNHEIEQPGLLDGAPGVALALLAAATPVEPTWDRLFLLS